MLFLLDNSVSIAGDTFCEWLNIHYSLLPDETLPMKTDVQLSQLLIKGIVSNHQ
jgi:hypothetical protein